jgi:hypothetical protein
MKTKNIFKIFLNVLTLVIWLAISCPVRSAFTSARAATSERLTELASLRGTSPKGCSSSMFSATQPRYRPSKVYWEFSTCKDTRLVHNSAASGAVSLAFQNFSSWSILALREDYRIRITQLAQNSALQRFGAFFVNLDYRSRLGRNYQSHTSLFCRKSASKKTTSSFVAFLVQNYAASEVWRYRTLFGLKLFL